MRDQLEAIHKVGEVFMGISIYDDKDHSYEFATHVKFYKIYMHLVESA